tara:strand:- start:570 stop:2762 length:2193 start_codon:yes stop_codon:yes gene_type:complete
MLKNIIKFVSFVIILIISAALYLSYFGIETSKFNSEIKKQIKNKYDFVDLNFSKIKLLLDLKDFSVKLQTKNIDLNIYNNKIKINKLSTKISIFSYFNNEFAIENFHLNTEETEINSLINITRKFYNNLEMTLIDKVVKNGKILINANIEFNDDGTLANNYKLDGKVTNTNLLLINNKPINNLNFNFLINDKNYKFKEINFKYFDLLLNSKEISIEKKQKNFITSGNFKTPEVMLEKKEIENFFNQENLNYKINRIKFSSDNEFYFEIGNKFKIRKLKINSNFNVINAVINSLPKKIKQNLNIDEENIIFLKNVIQFKYEDNIFNVTGKGKLQIDNNQNDISYHASKENEKIHFKSEIQFKNLPFDLKIIDYKNDGSLKIAFNGLFNEKNQIYLDKLELKSSNDEFKITKLLINENKKINQFDSLSMNFKNQSNIKNDLQINRDKNSYIVEGKVFDMTNFINDLLFEESDQNNFLFNNQKKIFLFDLNKVYLDKEYFVEKFTGNISFNKNKIDNAKIDGKFSDGKVISFKVFNKNKSQITTLYSEFAEPLVKKYDFIKGFNGGLIDFYSIERNSFSESQLKIYDFKVKKIPALAKILTLASLQGIADLLTGEGIRFNELDMKFNSNSDKLEIDELYAIGPAISILMEGYVQKKPNLISLRGTLVPATTINKFVASIPLLGDILVGKKTGEGVFGVSFKIKGPKKDLNTTVNPIKTLAPRFITRTLEKIKK